MTFYLGSTAKPEVKYFPSLSKHYTEVTISSEIDKILICGNARHVYRTLLNAADGIRGHMASLGLDVILDQRESVDDRR